jgi:hypothetical protein
MSRSPNITVFRVTQHAHLLPHACYMYLPTQTLTKNFRFMYEPTLGSGTQTRCTKIRAGGDVFWARSVAEMLTSRS